ncbi:MAG: MFS transporter [Candidatus Kapaibacterium sp.]
MTNSYELNNKQKPKPTAILRWSALIFVSLAMFGNYYIYDSIPPVADLLISQLGFTQSQVGMIRSLYSLPNIIMVVISGFIIDRIGVKKSALIFSVLCAIGIAVTISGGKFFNMALGFFIFGVGAESLIVAVTTTIAKWFKGRTLSLAFGLNLTIARLGSVSAQISPDWAESLYTTWQGPLMLSLYAGIISVAAVVAYYAIDAYAEKRYQLGSPGEPDKVDLKKLFKFGPSFWYIVLLCVTFYSAIFPFQTFAVKLFQDVHGVTRESAGWLNSIPLWFTMVLTPIFGSMADKFGRRSALMIIGSVLIIPIYLMIVYVHSEVIFTIPVIDITVPLVPSMAMFLLGISFSLVPAVMWPAVALVVEEKRLGTAYGLMTMIQNIGLLLFNWLIGMVNDATGEYATGMWIFTSLGFFGLLFAFLLKRRETGPHGHGLEQPSI